mmetsp:Transcript_56227/g.174379  ORF Transcript_56227/g.174379 Transcript_56227/m.174379 type:complete len:201 (+) Transcript_56227:3024-3626(+)
MLEPLEGTHRRRGLPPALVLRLGSHTVWIIWIVCRGPRNPGIHKPCPQVTGTNEDVVEGGAPIEVLIAPNETSIRPQGLQGPLQHIVHDMAALQDHAARARFLAHVRHEAGSGRTVPIELEDMVLLCLGNSALALQEPLAVALRCKFQPVVGVPDLRHVLHERKAQQGVQQDQVGHNVHDLEPPVQEIRQFNVNARIIWN